MSRIRQHLPRKRFGQHFLEDGLVIECIVNAINPQAGQHIVEIGPGLGALTTPLVKSAARVTAVELDRDLIPLLRTRFANDQNFSVFQADALKFDFSSLVETIAESNYKRQHPDCPPTGDTAQSASLRLVGNLPYNISTPLIFHCLHSAASIADMHFMLQKEVVERLVAKPGSRQFGRLSIMAQYHCQLDSVLDVAPDAFYPPPKVWSAVVRMTPYATPPYPCKNQSLLHRLVRQAFSMRRKTLRNALRNEVSSEQFHELAIDPKARPEMLSLADYVRLTNFIDQNLNGKM